MTDPRTIETVRLQATQPATASRYLAQTASSDNTSWCKWLSFCGRPNRVPRSDNGAGAGEGAPHGEDGAPIAIPNGRHGHADHRRVDGAAAMPRRNGFLLAAADRRLSASSCLGWSIPKTAAFLSSVTAPRP
jgi:hypothetical protein